MTMTRTACHTLAMRGITVAAAAAALTMTATGPAAGLPDDYSAHRGPYGFTAYAAEDGVHLTLLNHSGHPAQLVLQVYRPAPAIDTVRRPVLASGAVRELVVPWRGGSEIRVAFSLANGASLDESPAMTAP